MFSKFLNKINFDKIKNFFNENFNFEEFNLKNFDWNKLNLKNIDWKQFTNPKNYRITIYDKYILSQVIFATFGSIILFTIVWIAPEMLLNMIKETLQGMHTIPEAIFLLSLEVPNILGKAFPVGLLLGTLFTFDKLSKDSELTILRAIGLSFKRIIAPIIILSFFISILCFITYDKLIPYAECKMREIEHNYPAIQYIYTQKNDKGEPLVAVVVSSYKKNTVKNVIVLDFSQKIFDDVHGITRIYSSPFGKIFKDYWRLYDVTEYKISNNGVYIDVANPKYIDILKGESAQNSKILMENSEKKEREITNSDLSKYIKLLKKENIQEEHDYMLNKYYQRFFHPFVCMLLAIMGCILGFSKPREQRLIGFTIAIGTIFLYYITLPFFDLLAEKGVLPPLLTALIPPLAFFYAITVFYKHKDL